MRTIIMNRRERFEPMEYKNGKLMDELNDWCICLKVWLYPDEFGEKRSDLQNRYPKPSISNIDGLQHKLNEVLRQDAKPLIKY